MKYIKNIFKISIVLLLLLICVGSIYAADTSHFSLGTGSDMDDFDDLEGDDLSGLDDDDGGDYGLDDDLEDYDCDDDDCDDNLDDYDFDDIEDDNDTSDNYNFTEFDYLRLKINYYLYKYGNCSYFNWTDSEEFLNEYSLYLIDSSNYTLNNCTEGYETYLKIFDSIISTFPEYNLTENETDYLKFMVIFYLNHYGNVSANYTWNESENFANFSFRYLSSIAEIAKVISFHSEFKYSNVYNPLFYPYGNNSTDVNQTAINSPIYAEPQYSSGEVNIFLLILIFVFLIVVMI